MSTFRKEAKAAIDTKDYDQVITICEYGLECDKKDHLLMVFKGVALKNLSRYKEALEMFENASKVAPEQLLVWKGYLNIIETLQSNSTSADYILEKKECVLKKLITLDSVESRNQYTMHLVNTLEDLRKYKEAAILLKELSTEFDVFQSKTRLIELWSSWEEEEIRSQLEKEKFRLSNDSFEVTGKKITSQVYSKSPLTELLIQEDRKEQVFKRLDAYCPREHELFYEKLIDELKLSNKLAANKYLDNLDVSNLEEYPKEVLSFLNDSYCQFILTQQKAINLNSAIGMFQSFVYCFYLFSKEQFSSCLKTTNSILDKFSASRKIGLEKLKATCFYKLGEYSAAINLLTIFKEDGDLREYLIDSYDKLKMHHLAADLLPIGSIKRLWQLYKANNIDILDEELLKINETNPDTLVLKGLVIWHRNQDISKALKLWQQALEENNSFSLPYHYTGLHYLGQHMYERAQENLLRAVSLDKGNLESVLYLAHLWIKMEKFVQLLDLLGKRSDKKNSWRVHFYMGVAYESLEEYDEAALSFQESLKLYRKEDLDIFCTIDQTSILRHLAFCYQKDGKYQSALRAYKKLLVEFDNEEEFLDVRLGLFEVYLQDANLTEALNIVSFVEERSLKLYLLRRLLREALDEFDGQVIKEVKAIILTLEFSHVIDYSVWELFFLASILDMLKLEIVEINDQIVNLLPRNVARKTNSTSGLLCHYSLERNIDNKELKVQIELLLNIDISDESLTVKDNNLRLLNEAITENSMEKFERLCIIDPTGYHGLAWIGRYLLTNDCSFLISAIEWVNDLGWLKFCIYSLSYINTQIDNELLMTALERIFNVEEAIYGKANELTSAWLARLLERQGLLEEANEKFINDKDKERASILLGNGKGDLSILLNNLANLYQAEEEKAFELMNNLQNEWDILPFITALKILSDSPIDNKEEITKYEFEFPYQQWKWIKLQYVSNLDPSIILNYFKNSRSLNSLYIALDVLILFPDNEIIRQAIKERKHIWQDSFEMDGKKGRINGFYSRIGKNYYERISDRLKL